MSSAHLGQPAVQREPEQPPSDPAAVPLCVDLDGTLVRSDTLIEGLLSVLGGPGILRLPQLLATSNRAAFKSKVAELGPIDPALLPYNEDVLAYLRAQKAAGRKLFLVTAADACIAQGVAEHLGLFDEVLCSDGRNNLKGPAKAKALVDRFGRGGFAYLGNDDHDLPVWREARSIGIVNAPAGVAAAARKGATVEIEIRTRPSVLRAALKVMRPHQWAKNLLVFVPMVMAHAVADPQAWGNALVMLLAFCAAASSIYITNDLVDLEADRRHPRKRRRPLANGSLPIPLGAAMAVGLFVIGLVAANAVGALTVILLYVGASTAYSFFLKKKPIVDVFLLAGLYTIRVLGGGIATEHPASVWLLAFSGFLFLSLALVKRTEEMLAVARSEGERSASRRGYKVEDIPILQMFGCSSAFSSSVVLALFVGSTAASQNYRSPEMLWVIVPLILFWQCRLWLSAARGWMHDDPIVFAMRDWVSWLVVISVLAVVAAAAYGDPGLLRGIL
jgi:4-hydroxybenzoate polyprenyltransferase/phosphoserine phosphatase